jgi:aryl-alcohol dehydrogenase
MITTTAAVTRAQGAAFSFEQISIEDPREDEVLVKISAVGICHTDLAAMHGQLPVSTPIVLGHEGSGHVVEVGSAVTQFKAGDAVALSFASCGHCRNCLTGVPANCTQFTALNFGGAREDGSTALRGRQGDIHGSFFGQSSFAGYALAAERNVIRIPDSVPVEIAGPLGCGIQTGAGAVLNSLGVGAGASLVVIGCGAVGLSAVMAAKVVGATRIIAVDVLEERLLAAKSLGATHAVNGASEDVGGQLLALSGGADYCIDTTGQRDAIASAAGAVRRGGVIGLVGFGKPGTSIDLDLFKGKTFMGILEGHSVPKVFIPRLLDLYQAGLFPFDKLITTYPFAEIQRAIADTKTGAAIKAVLTM